MFIIQRRGRNREPRGFLCGATAATVYGGVVFESGDVDQEQHP